MSKTRILIVEDHAIVARSIAQQLALFGYEPVAQTPRGEEALILAEQLRPDLVLMDIQLAGEMDGIAVAQAIRERFAIPVVFLTAFVDDATLERAKLTEPFGYIVKPFQDRELRTVIEMALYKHQAETRLRNSQEEVTTILRTAMDGFWLADTEGRFLEVNDAFCQLTGYSREELLRMAICDVEADETPAEIAANIERILRLGSARFERRQRRKDGELVHMEVSVNYLSKGGGRLVCFSRDITERNAREREIERLNKLYSALSVLNQTIVHVKSREELFREVCRIATEKAGFKVVWIGWLDPNTHVVNPVARAGNDDGYLDDIKIYADDRPEGRGPVGTCIREHKTIIFNDFLNDPLAAPWHIAATEHGLRAATALPIRGHGEVCGVLTVYADEPRVFQDKEVALLEEAAAAVSSALESLDREAQRKLSEQALLQSENRYRLVSSAISDIIYSCSVTASGAYAIDWMSGAIERITGYSANELKGRGCWCALVIEEDLPLFNEHVIGLALGSSGSCELRLRHRDGSVRWVASVAQCVLSSGDPRTRNLYGGLVDITQRKRAENMLREAQDYTDNIIRSMADMLVVLSPNGTITTVNKATCDLLGYSEDELIGQLATLLFEEEEEEEDILQYILAQRPLPVKRTVLRRLVKEGSVSNVEKSLRTKSGIRISVLLSGSIMRDDEGEIRGIVCLALDITQRKRADELLRQSEERFRVMFEVASIGIAQADSQTGRWLRVNQRMCAITGYSAAELLQMRVPDITHPEDRQKDWEAFQRVVQGQAPDYHMEKRYVRKDGSIIWVNVNMTVVPNAAGQPARTMATIEDITERKRMDDALVRTKIAAEAANRAKSEFLANMSHEIRTPMTAILGFSDLLASPNVPYQERREFLAGIQRNGKALLELIGDILDLSRIEADRLTLEKANYPLQQIVDDVFSVVQVRAEQKGLALEVDYAFPLPETIHTDPVRLRQVLTNLTGNAVKFTERGAVRITVRCTRETDGSGRMQFAISDTGMGIPADKIGELFEPFSQVDGSASRRYGGTGLGLAISRRLAKALGGDVEVTSQLDKGSTFTLTIDAGPLKGMHMLQSPDSPSSAEQELSSMEHNVLLYGRVLLVEDVPDVCVALRYILRWMNLESDVADSGDLACEMAEKSRADGRPYDLILMDIQMPGMNGYGATRWLRQHGWEGPIVALTAHALVGDREKCLEAGCNDYIAKPITGSGLRNALLRYFGGGDSGSRIPERRSGESLAN